jgi:hypothetical protein
MPLYTIKHFGINRRTPGKVNPEVFFIAHSFQYQEGIGQRHQRDIMILPLPRAAFKMIQPHFPLHLLVILFNMKASFRLSDQPPERSPMNEEANWKASTSRGLYPPPTIRSTTLAVVPSSSFLAPTHWPSKSLPEQNGKTEAL